MANLANSILATLAYYDIFDYPLTLTEIHKYLINPARVQVLSEGVAQIALSDIAGELEFLVRTSRVKIVNGYYVLSDDRTRLYELRIEREKLAAQKWKKLIRAGRWFRTVPYIRGIFVSGSLALNNSTEKSDFDVLIVAKARRLYTCRFALLAVASLLGVRRKKEDVIAPDKFCFNHYITDSKMAIEWRSLFTAQAYSVLVPVFTRPGTARSFYAGNEWINKYVFNFRPGSEVIKKKLPAGSILDKIATLGERLLDSSLGGVVERALKHYQQKLIRENPVTHELGGRTVYTDTELEFHARSLESTLISRYNEKIKKLGIQPPSPETDSGLTRA